MEHGPITARLSALLRRAAVRRALAVACGAGALSPLSPLLDVPGYESALAANLVVAFLGGALGVAAARLERSIARGERPAIAGGPAGTSVLRAWAAAFLLACCAIAVFLGAALLAALFGSACSATAGLPWYPLLPLPSALLATALGVACGAATERRFLPGALYALALAASFAWTAWPVLTGPQVFLYDHLLGFLPGPLYDEVVRIGRPLLVFRLLTLVASVLVAAITVVLWDGGRLRRPRLRPAAAVAAAVAASVTFAGVRAASETGWRQSNETVARALGGHTAGARCDVFHPREARRDRVRRFVDECDAHVRELEAFFGREGPRPQVFLHRSAEEKRALVGASGTQFAKPWLAQLHVDERGRPHPVLKHELAHVVAASIGRPPFAVTAVALGVLPVQGLVEGAAVAADWPAGELTVHEQARAMRELGIAPALPRILSALGFYGESARRAYTYAGSFVRWLVETRGPEPFAAVYRDGDFEAAYGVPLASLVGEWERFLDGVELPARARAIAERRFRRPAIFRRPCAREVAELSGAARAAMAAGDPAEASELWGRCAALDPGDPGFLAARAEAYAAQGRPADVEGMLALLDAHPAKDELLLARLLGSLGDAHAARGALDEAASAWRRARELRLDADTERALDVKLDAVGDPARAAAVLPYLAHGGEGRLLAIRELLARHDDWATGWYLVARRAWQRDEPALAVGLLDRALELGLPSPAVTREALRMRALALLDAGRPTEACAGLEALAGEGAPGARLEAERLLALCRHRLTRAGAPP